MKPTNEQLAINPVAIAHIGGEATALAIEHAHDLETRAEAVGAANEELEPQGVMVVDLRERPASRAKEVVGQRLDRLVDRGVLLPEDAEVRRKRITAVLLKRQRATRP